MGEIRSTLDIIMEKAKEVEVTEEDKAAFMAREVEGKVRGLLQRYSDGVLTRARLQEEMALFEGERHETAVSVLRKECLSRMTPEGDNGELLDLLRDQGGVNTQPVESVIRRYKQDRDTEQVRREDLLKEGLAKKGIAGSAVMPNLNADPGWIRYASELHDRFQREMAAVSSSS